MYYILSEDGKTLVSYSTVHRNITIKGNRIRSSIRVEGYDEPLFSGSEDECKDKLLEFAFDWAKDFYSREPKFMRT